VSGVVFEKRFVSGHGFSHAGNWSSKEEGFSPLQRLKAHSEKFRVRHA
jgi:hypothetical protein